MKSGRPILVTAVLVVSLLAVPAGTASAQECSLDPTALEPLVTVYNENLDQMPGIARGQLADQRIDLRIDTTAGEHRFGVSTDSDGRITTFEETPVEDPTLRVEVSETAICDILTSEDPTTAFADAYEGGAIDVSGVGIVNSVVVGAVKIGAGVAKWLSGLF